MKTIIDMNNLMHQLEQCRDAIKAGQLHRAMNATLEFVITSPQTRGAIVAVFDGAKNFELQHFGPVQVIFSHPSDADSKIKSIIRKHSPRQRSQLLIISNDRDILRFAEKYDTPFMTVDDFIYNSAIKSQHSGNISEKPDDISEAEIELFKQLFDSKRKNDTNE